MFSRKRRSEVGFHDITELPPDGIRGNRPLNPADPARRHKPLEQAPQYAPDSHIHFENHARFPLIPRHLEADVRDPHYLPAIDVDNLLIEKIALDAQHVLVGMVWIELFVAELDSIQGNGCNLIVTDREPGGPGAHKIAIDSRGVNERNNGGVAHAADTAMLQGRSTGRPEKIREVEEAFFSAFYATPERESRFLQPTVFGRRRSGNPKSDQDYIGFERLTSLCRTRACRGKGKRGTCGGSRACVSVT